MNDFKQDKMLAQLLPYDPMQKHHSKLKDGLKEYKMLFIAAERALSSFLRGTLSDLDSLVGENACQIRATLLVLIVRQQTVRVSLLQEVGRLTTKIEEESQKLDCSEIEGLVTLGDFLEIKNLHLNLNYHELFVVASYILTQVRVLLPSNHEKKIVRNEHTDTRKVKEISAVGSTFARDLVKKLRHIISVYSVTFVQDIAKVLPLPTSVMEMISDKYCVNHDKFGRLKCLPCFWYTFVLMQYALSIRLPIVLIMSQIISDRNFETLGQISIYYDVVNGKYQEVRKNDLSVDEVALVIFGSCCRKKEEFQDFDSWKQEITRFDLTELILAYSAAHRQYPDENKDILVSQSSCELFSFYKLKSLDWGCSLSNPSLFFLVHAYSDRISNVVDI